MLDLKARRPRWSLSTRIFLAFALVVAATGAASLYALASVAALRHELGFLRQQALPLLDEVRQSAEALRGFDEALQRAAPEDLEWVVRLLPNARPYQRVERVLSRSHRADQLARPPQLVQWLWQTKPPLPALDAELVPLRTSREMLDRIGQDHELAQAAGNLQRATTDAAAYDVLASGLQRAIADRRLPDAARLVVELRRMIRQVHGALGKAQVAFEKGLAARADQAQQAESNLVALVASTAALSLLVSVLMLLVSVVALRPLGALTEVVRRFAQGDRQARASAAGAEEIALLADEWNRMAGALTDREAQLLAQREELGRAERLTALGHMAARMAHEVRNPLSSIGLNAEMLGEELAAGQELDRSEARELVAAIGAEVERLRELTEGYLARTRPDQGSLQEFDLTALVHEIVEFLRPELDRRGVTVVIAAEPLALVHGDAGGMRQVLWNLLRNAWEAQQPGGKVWLEVAVLGTEVVLAVEDAGPGVPEALAEQVFQPFFTNKAQGTGIGLAVVREIARQHQGTVQLVAGRYGTGARFEVVVPGVGGRAAMSPVLTQGEARG